MKTTIKLKENCITVSTKNESETLYDTDLVTMFGESLTDFTNNVYDYFEVELEDAEINYKELSQICKKVYNSLK